MTVDMRHTARGDVVEYNKTSAPTEEKLPDGQHKDHWVLSPEERARGWIRPLRETYRHVGREAPDNLHDLTEEQLARYKDYGYVKYQKYEGESAVVGRYWTQEDLDKLNNACGAVTRMPLACAETYAKEPTYYGSTFCVGCRAYHPVEEFVWEDDGERVGS